MNENKFKKIDDLNKTLENIYYLVDKSLTEFDVDEMTQEQAQSLVDDLCIRISNSINNKLIDKRADLINSLHEGYISSNEIIQQLEPLVNFNLNVDTVVEAVQKIITIIAGPYQKAVEYVTLLTPKVLELANNIANLSTLQDKIPKHPSMPLLNYNKLQITMPPITVDEIITGNKISGSDNNIA